MDQMKMPFEREAWRPAATTKDSSAVPHGMIEVTREEFWAAVKAETRNVLPSPYRHHTEWMVVGTNYRWGWVGGGYASPHNHVPRYALAHAKENPGHG